VLPPVLASLIAAIVAVQDPRPVRNATIGRIDAEQAPRIDGELSDACWQGAPAIGELVEVEPRVGAVPGQRTVVRILHDARHFFMAIECFDDDPESIRATQRARDAELNPDDRVEWFFDTFRSRRNAVWFQIGAAGSRGDALLGEGFEKSWDTIWDGASRVTPRGWQAEVEIPFQSLAFPDGASSWGFNIRRLRRKTNEEYRWANIDQGQNFFRVAVAGALEGLGALEHGIGLDVVPFVAFQARRARLGGEDWRRDPDAGGDLFYRLTPSLSVAATFFTDFAETENDERQINLTRFPLFFPEKRDFFLEDASRFTFGPSSGRRGGGGSFVGFFSRRIGLDAGGDEVPILAGAKISGEEGPWEIGFLDVWTDATDNVGSERNLGVLRVKRALGEQTTLGVLGTLGRPTDPGRNATLGLDFYHREERFIGDQDLRVWIYGMGSQTSGPGGDGDIFGAEARGEGREWRWQAGSRWTTADFNPELGFIRRTGVKELDTDLRWLPRPEAGPVRNWEFGLGTRTVLDESNTVQDFEVRLQPLGVEIHNGDEASLSVERGFERVDRDFTIFRDRITVPAGDYWRTRVGLDLESSPGRRVASDLRFSTGDFFFGTSHEASADVNWRPAALLTLGGEYEWRQIRLAGERFDAQVVEGRLDFDFSVDLTLRNLVQYDNESRELGVQSRLRWTLEPGSDVFVVVGGGWQRGDDGVLRPDEQEITVKALHTFRF
jgi:hypothetical protein